MNPLQNHRLLLFLLFCSLFSWNVAAQPSVAIDSFLFDAGMDGWKNLPFNSPDQGLWQWSPEGRADGGPHWGVRGPIESASPGALMLDADGLQAGFERNTPIQATVKSPTISVGASLARKKIGICFTQYFRNGGAAVSVWGELNGEPLSPPIRLNENIRTNVETTAGNQQVVVLTESLPGDGKLEIFFRFEGLLYFWMLDDIYVKTLPDHYGGTLPEYVGDSLALVGRPYHVDSLGGAYKPNSLVVRWAQGTTEEAKDAIRQELAIARTDTCLCRDLESVMLASELTQDPDFNLIESGNFEEEGSARFFDMTSMPVADGCILMTTSIVERARDKCDLTGWADVYPPAGTGKMAVVYHDHSPLAGDKILRIPVSGLTPDAYYFFSFDIYMNINGGAPEAPVLQTSDTGTLEFVWDNDSSPANRQIRVDPGGWANYQAVFKALDQEAEISLEFFSLHGGPGQYAFALDNLYMAGVSSSGGRGLGIIETKNGGGANNSVQDIDFNYYTRSYFQAGTSDTVLPALESAAQTGAGPMSGGETVIAIIDTGVDWDHACFQGRTWINNAEYHGGVANGIDEDGNCARDDFLGWNFVAGFNNPFDDHGHGTHVACIALENAMGFSPPENNCEYRIMPLKALAYDGAGELFHAACATLYAIENGADVVNCSFIWNGEPSAVMDGLIDEGFEAGVFFVTAAGNDTADLRQNNYYPANYADKLNQLTVGAAKGNEMEPFSNYGNTIVEVAALGIAECALPDVLPGNTNRGVKTGTSMAAPQVAAAVAVLYCGEGGNPALPAVRETIMACSDHYEDLEWAIIGGNVFNPDNVCVTTGTGEPAPDMAVYLFPNPTSGGVKLEVDAGLGSPFAVEVFGLAGKLLYRLERQGLLPDERLELDFSGLPAGLYSLRISQSARYWTGRFVKY